MKQFNAFGGNTNSKFDIEITVKETTDALRPVMVNAMFDIAREQTIQRPITLDIVWDNGDKESQTR